MSHSVMKKDYTNTKLLWLGSIKKIFELPISLKKGILVYT